MNAAVPILRSRLWLALVGLCLLVPRLAAAAPVKVGEITFVAQPAEILRAGAQVWDAIQLTATTTNVYAGDQLRTGERGRITVSLTRDRSIVKLDEFTQTEFSAKQTGVLANVVRGVLSFFHRDEPGNLEVRSGVAMALVRGTEFAFAVGSDGTVQLTLLDGWVQLSNPLGSVEVHSGDVAVASPNAKPQVTAHLSESPIEAIQWQLYYPAILDPRELNLPEEVKTALAPALELYRQGDLLGALGAYPKGRQPVDPQEQLLLAGWVLAVGNVAECERRLDQLPADPRLNRVAHALRQLIAAAQMRPCEERTETGVSEVDAGSRLTTEWLALSYCRQAARDLEGALAAARQATVVAPDFGFAWARVASLEFSFGRQREARAALERALERSPRNAAAEALAGFLAASRFEYRRALEHFDRARGLDPRLADGWLGRGLIELRQGRTDEALADLAMAAASEPQRASLRSALGRAYSADHQLERAGHELDLAQNLDPEDPTVWLYRALLFQQESRINEAIRTFGVAESLVDERGVYRSPTLLGQDRAVIGANRATAYRDGGLEAIGRREAGRSLSLDAANPAAHRFLADSYGSSERVNLRYESARTAEYLQANLLAPVGNGPLSASISQQDYSPLYERDQPHLYSTTSYQEIGGWEQSGGVYGTEGRLGYGVDAYYASGSGTVTNTDFEQTAVEAQVKVEATDRDSFYLQGLGAWQNAGDLATYADPLLRNPDLRTQEDLQPVLVAGWHRTWSPEQHTLVLAGWVNSTQNASDPTSSTLEVVPNALGQARYFSVVPVAMDYQAEESWLSLEAQHLWETSLNTFVVGGKFQSGELTAANDFRGLDPIYVPSLTRADHTSRRLQAYAYDTWRCLDSLALTLGLSADALTYPVNFRSGPLSGGEEQTSQASPKAGFVWQPRTNLWVRGAYTRSLAGVGLEQSFRLEPTQVAGFNQTFRSLLPESVVGAVSGASIETANLAVETQLQANTLVGIEGEWLHSTGDQTLGVYGYREGAIDTFTPSVLDQQLTLTDPSISAYVGQLIHRDWTVFLRYRIGFTDFESFFPGVAPNASFFEGGRYPVQSETNLTTQAITLSGRFNHPTGWFAGADVTWTQQIGSMGVAPQDSSLPEEHLWMINLFIGHRFWQRRVQVLVGVENLANQNYRLSPVTLIAAPPQERSFVAQLKWTY